MSSGYRHTFQPKASYNVKSGHLCYTNAISISGNFFGDVVHADLNVCIQYLGSHKEDMPQYAGISPDEFDYVVVNSSLFNPDPSHSTMVAERFKLRPDVQRFDLGGKRLLSTLPWKSPYKEEVMKCLMGQNPYLMWCKFRLLVTLRYDD